MARQTTGVAFFPILLILLILPTNIAGLLPKYRETFQEKASVLQAVSHENAVDVDNKNEAIVVGGGPVGLSAALVLANHGYDVNVFEASPTEEIKTFNPALAYLYNINGRGQVFTKMFPSIHKRLLEKSVASTDTRFFVAPADAEKKIQYPTVPTGGGSTSYWIARHQMVELLWDAVDEHNSLTRDDNIIGRIHYEQGVHCLSVQPSTEHDDRVSVVLKRKSNGQEKTAEAKLVVGADGINSQVRECLRKRSGLFGSWNYNSDKFKVRKWTSPATGLKLKALQMPADKYAVRDSDGKMIPAKKNDFVAVRGQNTGPLDMLSLGSLPVLESNTIRPVNCITRPNHVLWTMMDGAEVKAWFKVNYPRLDLDGLISNEEWERFAKASGLTFPPCQYSPGLQVSSESDDCGVVLLGDAAHAFSPDIGQGINAGLMDTVRFNEILATTGDSKDSTESKKLSLGAALKEYERIQAPETRALIRLARFGGPYQYNQPLLKDRIGKKLWTANVILRVLLNKISFGMFPKPMVLMMNVKELSYRQIVRRADLGTAGLICIFAFLLLKVIVKL